MGSHRVRHDWSDLAENEKSQSGTASFCMILAIWHSGKGKTFGDKTNTIGFQGLGGGEEECIGAAYGIFRGEKLFCMII